LLGTYSRFEGNAYSLFYLRDSLHLPDAALLSVLRIRNDSRQKDDTVYVFTSDSYVLFMPTPFRNKTAEGFYFSSKLPPLNRIGYKMVHYSTTDTSFLTGGKTYSPVAYISFADTSATANGLLSITHGKELYLSKQHGLLQFANSYSNRQPVYGFYAWKVTHSFLN
jgi:hypothetical protein